MEGKWIDWWNDLIEEGTQKGVCGCGCYAMEKRRQWENGWWWYPLYLFPKRVIFRPFFFYSLFSSSSFSSFHSFHVLHSFSFSLHFCYFLRIAQTTNVREESSTIIKKREKEKSSSWTRILCRLHHLSITFPTSIPYPVSSSCLVSLPSILFLSSRLLLFNIHSSTVSDFSLYPCLE